MEKEGEISDMMMSQRIPIHFYSFSRGRDLNEESEKC